jgi:hypothetical protein
VTNPVLIKKRGMGADKLPTITLEIIVYRLTPMGEQRASLSTFTPSDFFTKTEGSSGDFFGGFLPSLAVGWLGAALKKSNCHIYHVT